MASPRPISPGEILEGTPSPTMSPRRSTPGEVLEGTPSPMASSTPVTPSEVSEGDVDGFHNGDHLFVAKLPRSQILIMKAMACNTRQIDGV